MNRSSHSYRNALRRNCLVQLARRCEAELFFASASMKGRSVHVEFERLDGDSPEELAASAAAKVGEIVRGVA